MSAIDDGFRFLAEMSHMTKIVELLGEDALAALNEAGYCVVPTESALTTSRLLTEAREELALLRGRSR